MGKLHCRLNNHFQHHRGAGFHALGFHPSRDLRQDMMPFMFDDDALRRSQATLLEQLTRLVRNTSADDGIAMKKLFASNCNDTPVTSNILNDQLLLLRQEGELAIVSPRRRRKAAIANDRLGRSDHLAAPTNPFQLAQDSLAAEPTPCLLAAPGSRSSTCVRMSDLRAGPGCLNSFPRTISGFPPGCFR